MLRVARLLGILALGLLAVPSYAELTRKIVVFQSSVDRAERLALARETGARIVRELPAINAVVIESQLGLVETAAAKLESLTEVKYVEADPKIKWLNAADVRGADFRVPDLKAITAPIRELRAKQGEVPEGPVDVEPQAQDIPWGIKRVNAAGAWPKTRGEGVKVAVIDTGVDKTHPDLAALLKGGWNAIKKNDEFNDDNGHGSHVAGTIAAIDDDKGVVGVAPKVDLYGVKVLDAQGSGTFDDVMAGMQWAIDNKMDVANMSLGADKENGNQALQDMVAAMHKAGVTLVAAAGNNGSDVGVPAAYPGAIAIAASGSSDSLAWFSSRGPEVAFIAPGVGVKSTWMNGGYQSISGTSMACPHAAGLAALYIAAHKGATPDQVRAGLAAASSKLPSVPDAGQGAGMPNAAKLVQ